MMAVLGWDPEGARFATFVLLNAMCGYMLFSLFLLRKHPERGPA